MFRTGHPTRSRKSAAEDLHVARQHDEVGLPGEHPERALLRLGLAARLDGNVVIGDAEALDVGAMVGVVGDDRDRRPCPARRGASARAGPAGSGPGARP